MCSYLLLLLRHMLPKEEEDGGGNNGNRKKDKPRISAKYDFSTRYMQVYGGHLLQCCYEPQGAS